MSNFIQIPCNLWVGPIKQVVRWMIEGEVLFLEVWADQYFHLKRLPYQVGGPSWQEFQVQRATPPSKVTTARVWVQTLDEGSEALRGLPVALQRHFIELLVRDQALLGTVSPTGASTSPPSTPLTGAHA